MPLYFEYQYLPNRFHSCDVIVDFDNTSIFIFSSLHAYIDYLFGIIQEN